jgi:hypothetical protein
MMSDVDLGHMGIGLHEEGEEVGSWVMRGRTERMRNFGGNF